MGQIGISPNWGRHHPKYSLNIFEHFYKPVKENRQHKIYFHFHFTANTAGEKDQKNGILSLFCILFSFTR